MTQLEALKAIAKRDGGLLRPQAVVDDARDEDSPLHGAFEWDDGVAAEKYRIDQAQRLIRSFYVIVDRENRQTEVPVFVNISTDRTAGSPLNPYRLTEEVAKAPDLMAQAVQDALEAYEALGKRYSHLDALAEIRAAVEKVSARERRKRA